MMMMSGPVWAWTAAVTRAWMSFWLIRSTWTCTPACFPNSAACWSKSTSAAWTKCDHWSRWSRVPRGAAGAWAWARMPDRPPPATAAPVVAAAPPSQVRRVIARGLVGLGRSSRVMAGPPRARERVGAAGRRGPGPAPGDQSHCATERSPGKGRGSAGAPRERALGRGRQPEPRADRQRVVEVHPVQPGQGLRRDAMAGGDRRERVPPADDDLAGGAGGRRDRGRSPRRRRPAGHRRHDQLPDAAQAAAGQVVQLAQALGRHPVQPRDLGEGLVAPDPVHAPTWGGWTGPRPGARPSNRGPAPGGSRSV